VYAPAREVAKAPAPAPAPTPRPTHSGECQSIRANAHATCTLTRRIRTNAHEWARECAHAHAHKFVQVQRWEGQEGLRTHKEQSGSLVRSKSCQFICADFAAPAAPGHSCQMQ
jgi:hypothetical protein